MGASESAQARQSHFQRPAPIPAPTVLEQGEDEPAISISNKMVERIVEDASVGSKTLLSEAVKASRDDHKDHIIMEKLKSLDEKHSERWRLRVQDLNEMANRIDRRTEHMMSLDPVCPLYKQAIIDCYDNAEASHGDYTKCYETINAFDNCVKEETYSRLSERLKRNAREHARRSRRVALARENVLKDLAPQPGAKKCDFEESAAS